MSLVLQKNYSLQAHHTLGFEVCAHRYARLTHWGQWRVVRAYIRAHAPHYFILGGGSNTFFSHNYQGLVVHIACKGIRVVAESADVVDLSIEAGESWDSVVDYATKRGWWGIENLASIPGCAGAAVVQNIGAYGAELSDTLLEVVAMDLHKDQQSQIWDAMACQLGYRHSVFKEQKNWLIQRIILRLHKSAKPILAYQGIQEALGKRAISEITPAVMAHTITQIRQRKLPNPQVWGNAGSFFKNPVLSATQWAALQSQLPRPIQARPVGSAFKISAAQLIEACGLKGYTHHHVRVSPQHALVLERHRPGPPQALVELIQHIQNTLEQRLGIKLISEVCIV